MRVGQPQILGASGDSTRRSVLERLGVDPRPAPEEVSRRDGRSRAGYTAVSLSGLPMAQTLRICDPSTSMLTTTNGVPSAR